MMTSSPETAYGSHSSVAWSSMWVKLKVFFQRGGFWLLDGGISSGGGLI